MSNPRVVKQAVQVNEALFRRLEKLRRALGRRDLMLEEIGQVLAARTQRDRGWHSETPAQRRPGTPTLQRSDTATLRHSDASAQQHATLILASPVAFSASPHTAPGATLPTACDIYGQTAPKAPAASLANACDILGEAVWSGTGDLGRQTGAGGTAEGV